MKKSLSITTKTFIGMICFGITMGLIFPFYAHLFTEYKPGMKIYFIIGCLIAGISVGIAAFYITKFLILNQIKNISSNMKNLTNGGFDIKNRFFVDSDDVIGELFGNFNKILDYLEQIVNEIKNTSEGLIYVAKEVSMGSDNVASSSQKHIVNVKQIYNSVKTVHNIIEENVNNIKDVNKFASDGKTLITN